MGETTKTAGRPRKCAGPQSSTTNKPNRKDNNIHIYIEELQDSLRRMQDLHTLHPASGQCLECHNPWPCDTNGFLTKATNAFHQHMEDPYDVDPAVELGKVLSVVEKRLGLEGPRAENVITELHHLVLEDGLVVTGNYGDVGSSYNVGVTTGPDSIRHLWRLHVGQKVIIEISAPTGGATNKRFLSHVLMETFSPRDADQVVFWWDNNDDACLRRLSLHYDEPLAMSKSILMLVAATRHFNDGFRTLLHKD